MPAVSTKSLRTVRQELLRALDIGATGTTTSAGGSGKKDFIDTVRHEPDNYWVTGQVHFTSGTDENTVARIETYVRSDGKLTFTPAATALIATSVTYELYKDWLKTSVDDAIKAAIEWARRRFLVSMYSEELTTATSTYEYALPTRKTVAATADAGGSTTTLIDASELTQANDYWNGALFIVTADTAQATNVGEVRIVSDFDAATDKITLDHALPGATGSGTTYRLIRFAFDYIYEVRYQNTDGEWVRLPGGGEAWYVEPGLYPRLLIRGPSLVTAKKLRVLGQRYPYTPDVERDLVEIPVEVLRPYVLYRLRWERGRSQRGAQNDLEVARMAREEAEVGLEQQVSLARPGSFPAA